MSFSEKADNTEKAYLPFANGLSALVCGSNWDNGDRCGPRTVNANNYPWNVNTNIGARLACDNKIVQRKRMRQQLRFCRSDAIFMCQIIRLWQLFL